MKREDLKVRVEKTRVVEHNGDEYHLRAPEWSAIADTLAPFKDEADPSYEDVIEATMRAVANTIVFDDGGPCSAEEAEMILRITGYAKSPVGRAALEMHGLSFDNDEEGDETPFS